MPDGATEIRPQPGPQTAFLSTPADIAIYGGAAGGGKSFALLLEPLRHIAKPDFGAVVFRREREQITNQGGLWDEARNVYPLFDAKANESDLFYKFPSGSTVGFSGIKQESDVLKWQGSQIPLLGFDELTHFTEYQFFYMLSRNRSVSDVRSYVRATCNPDAESWVSEFIAWWIDQATGFPIPERAGRIRWLVRNNDKNNWFDSRNEAEEFAAETFPHELEMAGGSAADFTKSVTFINADLFDNPALMKKDPGYLANLLAQSLIERERLLRGNWKVKATAGKVYNRAWFEIVDAIGRGGIDLRFFDLAATAKQIQKTQRKNDPDYTATVKLNYNRGVWTITDSFQLQAGPAAVEKLVMQVAEMDARDAKANGSRYALRWEIEPGSASIRENQRWVTLLRGYDAKGVASRVDKVQRSRAASVQAEVGNIKILRADWNSEFLTQIHGFPDLPHDDIPDAFSGAFNETNSTGLVLTK